MYSFKNHDDYLIEERLKGENVSLSKQTNTKGKVEGNNKNRAKIPGSTLILALDKIASPWLHEIGTVVLEFMTARMVLMILLFMLIIRLLSNDESANQKSMGLSILDKFAIADPHSVASNGRLRFQERG